MANIAISQLPPPPGLTGSGVPNGLDLIPATDASAITPSTPTGVTYKYTLAALFNYYLTGLGLVTYQAVRVATITALTATYSNGSFGVGATLTNSGVQTAITIDSVALSLNDRVLVWGQGVQSQNGLYYVSVVGTASTNWVLTRTTDFDQTSEIIQYGVVLVTQGATYAGRLFQEIGQTPIVIGTNPIVFDLYSIIFSQPFSWIDVTATTEAMTSNHGYLADNSSLVSLSLPAVSAVGDEIAISGKGTGGWIITQGAGQQIHIGNVSSTIGVTGSVASTNYTDSVRLVCTVADLTWTTTGGPQTTGFNIL